MNEVTRILSAIEQGDPRAAEQLLPLVYDELRRLAARSWPGRHRARRSRPRPWSTRPTCGWWAPQDPGWNSRGHFFAAAAEAMRRILVDNARRKRARRSAAAARPRRPRARPSVAIARLPDDLLALDEALDRAGPPMTPQRPSSSSCATSPG